VDALSGSFAAHLFEHHGPAVRKYLHRLTQEPSIADDLAQEVFLRVVRGSARYEPRDRERAWIFRIARNVLLDYSRRKRRSLEDVVPAEAVGAGTQGLRSDLHHALARLPDDERDAFLLGEIGGLTYAEIASMTETTVPSVRSRIYRARLALREMLRPPAPLTSGVFIRGEDDER
jgi:RNA polymerase sigma-70 factor (ECF subfamily)